MSTLRLRLRPRAVRVARDRVLLRRSRRPRGASAGRRRAASTSSTAVARAVESSQLDGNCEVEIGTSSVLPSTRTGFDHVVAARGSARCRRAAAARAAASTRLAGVEEHLVGEQPDHEAALVDRGVDRAREPELLGRLARSRPGSGCRLSSSACAMLWLIWLLDRLRDAVRRRQARRTPEDRGAARRRSAPACPRGLSGAGPPSRIPELPCSILPENACASDCFSAANFEMFTDEIDQSTMNSARSSVIMSA